VQTLRLAARAGAGARPRAGGAQRTPRPAPGGCRHGRPTPGGRRARAGPRRAPGALRPGSGCQLAYQPSGGPEVEKIACSTIWRKLQVQLADGAVSWSPSCTATHNAGRTPLEAALPIGTLQSMCAAQRRSRSEEGTGQTKTKTVSGPCAEMMLHTMSSLRPLVPSLARDDTHRAS
jgi:rubredoxin